MFYYFYELLYIFFCYSHVCGGRGYKNVPTLHTYNNIGLIVFCVYMSVRCVRNGYYGWSGELSFFKYFCRVFLFTMRHYKYSWGSWCCYLFFNKNGFNRNNVGATENFSNITCRIECMCLWCHSSLGGM